MLLCHEYLYNPLQLMIHCRRFTVGCKTTTLSKINMVQQHSAIVYSGLSSFLNH